MNYLLHSRKIFLLLLLICLLRIEVTSTQEGSSYFFYQQLEYPRDCKEAGKQCLSNTLSDVYVIKPDGYPQPFEVYCTNDVSSDGWTVIQRRINGSLTFRRNWEEYKSGFGFLSSEFWIGNDKLSYLTNQALYELRIDITLHNGSSFFVKYNNFRISDEWTNYTLVSAKDFRSNLSCIVSTCPINLTQDDCTCKSVCADPIGQTNCFTDCIETCIPQGCFVAETNSFIANGESFINVDCTQNCTCVDNQLTCNAHYECSNDAACTVKYGIRKCYCNDGYKGNGEVCIRLFKDCFEAYREDHTTSGIYTIMPTDWPGSPFEVFCNMTFGDGGWTVLQRRIDGVTNFNRNWTEYKQGFGILNQGNDFWLGNEQLHYLTDQKDYILRIDLVSSSDRPFYDEFTTFKIGDESTKYRLSYTSHRAGNTNDYRLYYNNGKKFSTPDQDNDECSNHNFAERHRGGWWYSDHWCSRCGGSTCRHFEYGSRGCHTLGTVTNLNGDYNGGNGETILYSTAYYIYCNYKYAEMKIRPSNP